MNKFLDIGFGNDFSDVTPNRGNNGKCCENVKLAVCIV